MSIHEKTEGVNPLIEQLNRHNRALKAESTAAKMTELQPEIDLLQNYLITFSLVHISSRGTENPQSMSEVCSNILRLPKFSILKDLLFCDPFFWTRMVSLVMTTASKHFQNAEPQQKRSENEIVGETYTLTEATQTVLQMLHTLKETYNNETR